jgi:GTP-binding protein EngB required for normal cell division
MNLPRSLRILIALAALVLALAALLLVLSLSEATLNIQARLSQAPWWLAYIWWGLLALGGVLFGWVIWRILRPSRPRKPAQADDDGALPTEEQVQAALARAAELGADTTAAQRELDELKRRREAGLIEVALFGEISTGKSALVRALLPGAEARSEVVGGTTRELTRYVWSSIAGDRLSLTDMPGTNEADGTLDRLASDEATRAHIVLYVTEGDLNRQQHATLAALIALRKPLILVLNKSDRYSAAEIEQLSARLGELIARHPHSALVTVSAATTREALRREADGSERVEQRPVAPRVKPLARALQRMIDDNEAILDRLRDSATFVLVHQYLDEAIAESRRRKAEALVDGYAVKAVVGALAAVAPGTDLLIQGYLGTQMVRELAALYDTKVSQLDTELLLKLVQQHVGKARTILLAVAGNALKAFPGLGTLVGGALHAVAYGIVFRTLGQALTTTLATRGEVHPRQTAKLFEEKMGGDLDTSARQLAKLVVAQIGKDRSAG